MNEAEIFFLQVALQSSGLDTLWAYITSIPPEDRNKDGELYLISERYRTHKLQKTAIERMIKSHQPGPVTAAYWKRYHQPKNIKGEVQ
jgi:hypothetical protein